MNILVMLLMPIFIVLVKLVVGIIFYKKVVSKMSQSQLTRDYKISYGIERNILKKELLSRSLT